jgi:hypothetical protein
MYTSLRTPGDAAPDATQSPPRSARSWLRLSLLPVAVVLWVIGIATTNAASLGPYGLVTALSPAFILGLAVLIISAGLEFAQPTLSDLRLGLHAVALVVMLYATGALVYAQGRYTWLYKTIGVVQYVNAHGSLDKTIDIYQSWPGFFALAAWFDRVAGVSGPLDYAKWAQLVFELAAIPLLHTIYRALSLRTWHSWLAVMLYSASNWIAQDYFSPQGLSTLLGLGVMAIIARWMFVLVPVKGDAGRSVEAQVRRALPFAAVALLLFFALTASHELTPYILTIQIAALAICGLTRPRWIALAVAAVTLAYLLPNFSYVNSHYGLISSIGSFFRNVRPPTSSGIYPTLALPASTRYLNYCADLLCLGIWALAIAGAWLNRKARRVVVALLLLTFSPVLVLVGGAYGNEGILRVYLFSLPWACALAACALAPLVRRKNSRTRSSNSGYSPFRVIIPLGLAVALFFPAFYGYDRSNVMTTDEVNTLLKFQETAKPGVVLAALENLPISETANYNDFPIGEIFGIDGIVTTNLGSTDVASYLARSLIHDVGRKPAYVVVTPSMTGYNDVNAVTFPSTIPNLVAALAKSPYWHLVVSRNGTVVYSFDTTAKVPAGPYADAVTAAVP